MRLGKVNRCSMRLFLLLYLLIDLKSDKEKEHEKEKDPDRRTFNRLSSSAVAVSAIG